MAELIRPGQGVAEESSREGLLFGAFAIFFLAFVMSGNANAIPQMFFQRFYPHQKNLLLSIPPWEHPEKVRDNWQAGPWDRALQARGLAVLGQKPGRPQSIDDHF